MSGFLQQILNGVSVGSIYALIALGYTMVYGIVKLINFAHGDILMMGAYFGMVFMTTSHLPFGLAIIVAMLACALFGVLIDRIAYKPLRNAPRISALITALGVSMFLENIFLVMFGAEQRKVEQAAYLKNTVEVGGVAITYGALLTIVISVVCMIALRFIVQKSKMGKAMRAVSEDQHAARLMGINVNSTISLTFAIGSALGALGGILYSTMWPQVDPYMGVIPGLKAFVAAVVGGIGVIPGAMFGGFSLGIAEALIKGYISSKWSTGIVFLILILFLLFKPAGIFGKNVREKV